MRLPIVPAFRCIMFSLQRCFCGLVLLCLFGMAEEVIAQNPGDPAASPKPAEASGSSAKPEKEAPPAKPKDEAKPASSADVIPLKNARGETILLFRTPLVEEVLAELEARRNRRPLEPLEWSVAGLSLEGNTDGETATLKATLKIQLLVEDKWIKVPLKLNEGILQEQSHSGPGEAASGGSDPAQGYFWWLKGKGLHVLNLTLNISLRKEQPSRRLLLTLPATVVSDLKLRVPMPRLTAKSDEQSRARLTVIPTSDGASQIEMVGLGQALDVRWQPQPELGSVETVLQAQTSISALIDGRTVLLDVTQKVVPLQGSFNQLQVRLPAGSELLQIKGDYYKEHTIDPKDPTLVLVMLKETASDTSTPIELKWKVRIEFPQQQDRILLQGFDVARAKLHAGYLAVKVQGDYRLEMAEEATQFVYRANLSSLAEAQPSFSSLDDVSSAYGFTRQPFQLVLNLRPEKPLVTVKPRLFLALVNDRMELFGEYDLQFYRGSIDEVKFGWPGWKDEGWKVDPVTSGSGLQETGLEDPQGISVKLVSRETTTTPRPGDKPGANGKGFTFTLHASRPLPSGQANQEFSLPGVLDANVQPADFVVVQADNLDVDLRPLNDTATRLQSVPLANSIPLPKSLEILQRRRDFRLDAPRPKFSIATTLQKQRISTSTDVEFTLEGSSLKLEQRLSYDVAYDRLSQVLLMVPDAWRDRAQYVVMVDGKETPVDPHDNFVTEGIRKQKRLILGAPLFGKFDVVVTVKLPLVIPPGLVSHNFDVPLVQAYDSEFTSTRVRVQKPKRQRLSVVGDGWTTQAPQGGASVWIATAKQSALTLQCDQSEGAWRQGMAVPRRLVQAVFSPQGDVYCQVQYRFAAYVPVLRLTFPAGSSRVNARWNQVVQEPAGLNQTAEAIASAMPGHRESFGRRDLQLLESQSAPGQFEALLPEIDSDAEHLVTVTYQLPRQPLMGAAAFHRLEVPELLTDGTPTQTFWQIQLPDNQHLWTLPTGFIPEFDWQMKSWWWTRTQRQSPQSLKSWIGESTDTKSTSDVSYSGSRYVFSSLDSSTNMSFRTLSTALIVLIGASMALVFGFILVNLPSSRHVLTFLWLGFLTTLAALWYSEPVLVLLQPACLGLALAVLATLAQRWRRKSRGIDPVVTLGAPSDILAAASSREEVLPSNSPEQLEAHPPLGLLPDPGVGL